MRYLISICICLLLVAPCMAETINVDANGSVDFNNIQAAINAAFDGDTVLVAPGTYTGPGNRDIDFLGKAITVRSESGPENCIIDCNATDANPHRAFSFCTHEDTNTVLEGFTITNGYLCNDNGAGIYCSGSSPTIKDCIITNNEAHTTAWFGTPDVYGGGIYCGENSNPRIINCTISNNKASNVGLTAWPIAGGGGIYCSGSSNTMIIDSTISGNSAKWGGGMWNSSSILTTIGCIFSGNSGGGMANFNSSPTIINCTFSGNSTGSEGGGMSNRQSTPILINCTLTGNSTESNGGGGIYNIYSHLRLTNTILWSNYAQGDVDESAQIYNGLGATVTINYSCIQIWTGDLEGIGNIDADPCFVEPGYWNANDTPDDVNDDFWVKGDYYLLPDSLCIDTGDPNYVAEPNETDLDGNPRVIDGRIDMGAYESNYIQVSMKLTPQMLNCSSKGKYVKAHLVLPEGFLPEDVDVNESAVAEPIGIESESIKVLGAGTGPVRLEICFDQEAFCAGLTETGEVEITVIGSLTTSRYFYATDTIKIKP